MERASRRKGGILNSTRGRLRHFMRSSTWFPQLVNHEMKNVPDSSTDVRRMYCTHSTPTNPEYEGNTARLLLHVVTASRLLCFMCFPPLDARKERERQDSIVCGSGLGKFATHTSIYLPGGNRERISIFGTPTISMVMISFLLFH